MKNISKFKKLFLKCSCDCSVLVVEKDKINNHNLYYFSLFSRGFNHKLSLLERLRWAREILFHGNIWSDYIVLEESDIKKLKEFLK